MCGIFGWFGHAPADPNELVVTLARMLHHRGPNDRGFQSGADWGLGFCRLSILDLSATGHQPMFTPDGRFGIVFNGEIYNYVELRRALEQTGEKFAGTSDTEVLLRLLARDGANALMQLNGMFAFALVDTERRTFLLARDRLGVKPLYYEIRPGQIRFASELKALLAWRDASRAIDSAAVAEYLALNYLSNETCIFQGYKKLPPAHWLAGSLDAPNQTRVAPYWHLELNGEQGDGALAQSEQDELANLLRDAVNIRLRSDVPLGIFLSGGLDSSLVATLSAQSSNGHRPLALTVGFAEREYDETILARATAERAGLEHRIIPQEPSSLTNVDRLAWFYDEPFGDASALPTFALCEAASKHATVFLSGDAGDEAFGGYRRYIESARHSRLLRRTARYIPAWSSRWMPTLSAWRYRLEKLTLPDAGWAAAFDGIPQDPALELIAHPDLRPLLKSAGNVMWRRWAQSRGDALTARQQALDYALYLPDDILVKMDRASMAHSIEVRSPFLDYRVVEWAARLPRAKLLNSQEGKLPLRKLGEQLLPPSVNTGIKRGFGVPLDAWFRQPDGQSFARERLLSKQAQARGWWNVDAVAQLIAAHQSGRGRDFGALLWRLLFLDAWARQYGDTNSFLQGYAIEKDLQSKYEPRLA
jgi:asparagine synthase (glutamine-hydrolysing)